MNQKIYKQNKKQTKLFPKFQSIPISLLQVGLMHDHVCFIAP